MKRAIIVGLATLIASSCQKPLDQRAVEIALQECDSISTRGVSIRSLDVADEPPLTLSEIAYVDNMLQNRSDCKLSVYVNKVEDREYVIEKKNSQFVMVYPSTLNGYHKIYP
jgi:hypothetical protein